MSKKIILIAFFAIMTIELYSQRPSMELTFSGVDGTAYVQLDSIMIMNRTQGVDTVLYWPDTLLSLNYLALPENPGENNTFRVLQNYPNPMADQTTVTLFVPKRDKVIILVSDVLGRVIVQHELVLDKGKHSFLFKPGHGNLFLFTALWQGHSSSIKILQQRLNPGRECSLDYSGSEGSSPQKKAMQDIRGFSFAPGDMLLFAGFADTLESGMLDFPAENTAYTFQFATNIPCPGTPTVNYEGQVYNTIQIFSQCWLKENMNVGAMIDGTVDQSDNGTIEKYCYYNRPDSCDKYGGFYQWDEMMQYTTQQGAQGICPPGWHPPTDEEWKVLEAAVDSQYGFGVWEWDISGDYRGYDAGANLKTTGGWNFNGNGTDLYGFSGQPAGFRDTGGTFCNAGEFGFWWTSTEYDYEAAWIRDLFRAFPGVYRDGDYTKVAGFSVRCLKDN